MTGLELSLRFNTSENEENAPLYVSLFRPDAGTGADKALLLTDLGRCYFNAQQNNRAIATYREAIELFEELEMGRSEMAASCYLELADLHTSTQEFQEAQRGYELAHSIYQELNSLMGLAVVEGNMGILAYRQKKYDEAIERHKLAQQLYRTLNMPREEAVDFNMLGVINLELGRLDEAERAFREALKIMQSINDVSRLRAVYNNLGLTAERAGRKHDAEQWFIQSLEFTRLSDGLNKFPAYRNLANLYADMARPQDAVRCAQKAVAILEQLGLDDPTAASLYTLLAEHAETQGDAEQAEKWRLKAAGGRRNAPEPTSEELRYR